MTSTTGCSISYSSSTNAHGGRNNNLNSTSTANVYRDCARSNHYIDLLGVLLAGRYVCSYTCYASHGDGSAPHTTFDIRRIISLAVRFCHHGCVRKLFLDSNVFGDNSCAVRQLIRITGVLQAHRHFGNCVRLGAVPNTSGRLLLRTKLCTSHLDIGVRVPAGSNLTLLTPRGSRSRLGTPVRAIGARVVAVGRDHGARGGTPGFIPTNRADRVVINTDGRASLRIVRLSDRFCGRCSQSQGDAWYRHPEETRWGRLDL